MQQQTSHCLPVCLYRILYLACKVDRWYGYPGSREPVTLIQIGCFVTAGGGGARAGSVKSL